MLKTNKDRIVYFVGTKGFFRQVLCAVQEVDTPPEVVWLSASVKSKSWWYAGDVVLVAAHPQCGGDAISKA